MAMHIVLVEPEIPQNTGNIARTCAATGSTLHLVGELGFSIEDKYVKRAGLDYWHLVDILRHATLDELIADAGSSAAFFFLTTHADKSYAQVQYPDSAYLVFGKETAGLGRDVVNKNFHHCVRIPMHREARSLNLSNAVAIVLYEALRQNAFPGLSAAAGVWEG